MRKVAEHIYQEKTSSGNPHARLSNLYLIHASPRSLLIDAGFYNDSSRETVLHMLEQLQIRLPDLDVFVTHNHPDHAGLASFLAEQGAHIFMKKEECETCALLCAYYSDGEAGSLARLHSYGFSDRQAREILQRSTAAEYRYHDYPWKDFPLTDVQVGDRLRYGPYDLEILDLSGHTRHQVGLVERTHKWLFTSDTLSKKDVLIISSTNSGENLLGAHWKTLDRLVREFGDFWVVPGHYSPFYGIDKAVENTKGYFRHMTNKLHTLLQKTGQALSLEEMLRAAFRYNEEGLSAEEPLKLHFRISNLLACLEDLVDRGQLCSETKDGVCRWRIP